MRAGALPGRAAGPVSVLALIVVACTGPGRALAWGAEGHLIAGRAAEPLLCARAAEQIRAQGGGQDLGELGLWADRVRNEDRYADSAPWHYLNIDDGESLAAFRHPPEGDVVWAIDRFAARVGDPRLSAGERSDALRFLVHFVVDIHQPLHVGLAEDRGGNLIELRFRGEPTNLHRFWDTHVIELSGLSIAEYVEALALPLARATEGTDARVWAAESLALRSEVYRYGSRRAEPPPEYQDRAERIARERLALAAMRLAATLNSVFCP